MDVMAENFKKRKPAKEASAFLLNIAWRVEKFKSFFTGKKPLLTKESAKVAISKTYFENDKFLAAFPQFRFTPLDQTISKACGKYMAQL